MTSDPTETVTPISVVIPWSGNRSFFRSLRSVAQAGIMAGDEVVLVRDGPLTPDAKEESQASIRNSGLPAGVRLTVGYRDTSGDDWGSAARTLGGGLASGDWVVYLDDDDAMNRGAFDIYRAALAAGAAWDEDGTPGPVHFRVVVNDGSIVHDDHALRVGNVSTLGILVPVAIARSVPWPAERYENDFDFLAAACDAVGWDAPRFVDTGPVATARVHRGT